MGVGLLRLQSFCWVHYLWYILSMIHNFRLIRWSKANFWLRPDAGINCFGNYSWLALKRVFHSKCPEISGGWCSASYPTGGAHSRPVERGWGRLPPSPATFEGPAVAQKYKVHHSGVARNFNSERAHLPSPLLSFLSFPPFTPSSLSCLVFSFLCLPRWVFFLPVFGCYYTSRVTSSSLLATLMYTSIMTLILSHLNFSISSPPLTSGNM